MPSAYIYNQPGLFLKIIFTTAAHQPYCFYVQSKAVCTSKLEYKWLGTLHKKKQVPFNFVEAVWKFWFSQRWKCWSSGLWRHVDFYIDTSTQWRYNAEYELHKYLILYNKFSCNFELPKILWTQHWHLQFRFTVLHWLSSTWHIHYAYLSYTKRFSNFIFIKTVITYAKK